MGWITTAQIKSRCGVEDFEILQAINDERISPFSKAGKPLFSKGRTFHHRVAIDRQEADRKNQDVLHRHHLNAERLAKKGFPMVRVVYPDYTALEDCLFVANEVFGVWDETGSSCEKKLTCHGLLQQPVFKEVLEAINTILVYCEENRPPKRNGAFDLCNRRHKGISKAMFERIWMTVPDAMKRTAGQKDENLKPKTE